MYRNEFLTTTKPVINNNAEENRNIHSNTYIALEKNLHAIIQTGSQVVCFLLEFKENT